MGETKFCHYTTAESAKNIIQYHSFYLSRLDKMNDQTECGRHKEEEKQIFIFSFCHSEAKNIPLYYLYSGIDGKGCRLQYTSKQVLSIVRNSVIYPVKDNSVMDKDSVYSTDEYDIYTGWCFYVAGQNGGFFRGKHVEDGDPDYKEFEKQKGCKYFVKSSYWKYENEYRIVIRFNKPIMAERIAMYYPEVNTRRGLSVLWAPEMSREELKEIEKEYRDENLQVSKMDVFDKEKIRMELLSRNKDLFQKWAKDHKE